MTRRARVILKSLRAAALRGRQLRPRPPRPASAPAASAASALRRAPGFQRHRAQRQPLAGQRQAEQAAGVGGAVAHLAVVLAAHRRRRQHDRGDQLAGREVGLDTAASRQAAGAGRRSAIVRVRAVRASPSRPPRQRRERHGHVGGVGGDAGLAGAQDRVACGAWPPIARSRRRARVCCRAWRCRRSRGSGCAASGCRRRSPCCAAAARRRRAAPGPAPDSACARAASAAAALAVAIAPMRRPPSAVCSISASGRRPTSIRCAGRSISSFIRSSRLVPPARNCAPGVSAAALAAPAALAARARR